MCMFWLNSSPQASCTDLRRLLWVRGKRIQLLAHGSKSEWSQGGTVVLRSSFVLCDSVCCSPAAGVCLWARTVVGGGVPLSHFLEASVSGQGNASGRILALACVWLSRRYFVEKPSPS